ncbi:hypothetical protein [Aureimonas psammosilenae]|uniref:hypothetical protein n=1 Tax=Aureimonas psammosilenae TaxID=2495496 RepID=UPI00126091C3|nr:hypothetical protein [Aureimonas psammosilenae]
MPDQFGITESADDDTDFATPEHFTIAIVTEPPGAFAITTWNGLPLCSQTIPSLKKLRLLGEGGLLTGHLQSIPNISAVTKVCINLPNNYDPVAGTPKLNTRSGLGSFIHLLEWLQVPIVVAHNSIWRHHVDEAYGVRSSVEHLQHIIPPFVEEDHPNEQRAEAVLLALTACNNPNWEGLQPNELSPIKRFLL